MKVPIDRRQFFRVSVKVKILYRILIESGEAQSETGKVAYTGDLSGGGVLLVLDEKYDVGDLLIMDIYFSDKELPVNVTGKIVWIKERGEKDALQYRSGIKFVHLEEIDRSRIMRFLFRVQGRKRT